MRFQRQRLSSQQAYDALKKKLVNQGKHEELEPIPEGRSQFILAYTEGKTRPILQLYDTGCGGILFKEGVLEKEIDAIREVPGPFYVNGVGDSTIHVNDDLYCPVSDNVILLEYFVAWNNMSICFRFHSCYWNMFINI